MTAFTVFFFRDLLVHRVILVFVENLVPLVHPAKEDLLVILAEEEARERTDLKVLGDLRVRLVIRVFPVLLVLKEKREISVKRVPLDLPVLLVNKALLVPRVSKANLEPPGQKELKDLKVKLEILDHLVLPDKTELM